MDNTKTRLILNQLRKYRKARGLKQRDAARILGLADGSSISKWERGVCLPSVINMFRLAALYRTLVDALYIDALRTIRDDIRRQEADAFRHETMAAKASDKGKRIAKIREQYREILGRAGLTDQEIDEMRKHVIRLAQTVCEHVWGKRFY